MTITYQSSHDDHSSQATTTTRSIAAKLAGRGEQLSNLWRVKHILEARELRLIRRRTTVGPQSCKLRQRGLTRATGLVLFYLHFVSAYLHKQTDRIDVTTTSTTGDLIAGTSHAANLIKRLHLLGERLVGLVVVVVVHSTSLNCEHQTNGFEFKVSLLTLLLEASCERRRCRRRAPTWPHLSLPVGASRPSVAAPTTTTTTTTTPLTNPTCSATSATLTGQSAPSGCCQLQSFC